jgi:hypothetical protein
MAYQSPAVERADAAHARSLPAPPLDLATVTTAADFTALSGADRTRLLEADPDRYRRLRDEAGNPVPGRRTFR